VDKSVVANEYVKDLTRMNHDRHDDADLFRNHPTIAAPEISSLVF